MFFRKPNPLLLTQYENYSFVATFDKISSNNKVYLLKLLRGLKTPQKFCMEGKKVDLICKKYRMLNTDLT